MMKYILTAAMILAAPMAFAQTETVIQSGGESSHSETRDTTSTTNGGIVSTHDDVESHQQSDTAPAVVAVPATSSSSTTIDQTHIDAHGAVHDTTTQDTQSDND